MAAAKKVWRSPASLEKRKQWAKKYYLRTKAHRLELIAALPAEERERRRLRRLETTRLWGQRNAERRRNRPRNLIAEKLRYEKNKALGRFREPKRKYAAQWRAANHERVKQYWKKYYASVKGQRSSANKMAKKLLGIQNAPPEILDIYLLRRAIKKELRA